MCHEICWEKFDLCKGFVLEPKNRHKEQCHRLLHAHGHSHGRRIPLVQTATPGTQGSHGRLGALALHMWGWLTSERVCTHLPQTTLVLSMGHVTPSLAGILGVAAATRALHRRPLLGTHLLSLECANWASGQCPPGWKGQQHSLKLPLDRCLPPSVALETSVLEMSFFRKKFTGYTPVN